MFLWLTRGWNWLTAKWSKIKLPSRKGSYRLEPMKTIATDNLFDLITWHKWTAISITGSIIIIYLNLTEYAIGGELGKNSAQTANILGALQLVIKAHELCIVASLVCIAKQWILSSFMDADRGMVLGLLGAEGVLAQPSFLISKEFYAAISYGLSGLWCQGDTAKKRQIFTLSLFLLLACVISALSGPASGALMVPRVDWFFEKYFTHPTLVPTQHFPHVLIGHQYIHGKYVVDGSTELFNPVLFQNISNLLGYWVGYQAHQDMTTGNTSTLQRGGNNYEFIFARTITNTSTIWNRAMGGDWTGSSTATTAMKMSDVQITDALLNRYYENSRIEGYQSKWKGVKYETDGAAVRVQTECHYGLKQQCDSGNSTDWCYTRSSRDSTLQSSRNLLLLFRDGEERYRLGLSVYLTEGPRSMKFPNFAASIDFVIEGIESSAGDPRTLNPIWNDHTTIPRLGIIVCSTSARIGSTTITASDTMVYHKYSPYADYQILANGTKESSSPLLFHEHWIGAVGALSEVVNANYNAPITSTGKDNVGPRNPNIVTPNRILQEIGYLLVVQFWKASLKPLQERVVRDIEAAEIELPISGAMSALLSRMWPTYSQYALPATDRLPDTYLPRQHFYDDQTEATIKVYQLGYGFRLSTRTGVLGIAVLLCHAVIALAGSFWQVFRWRKVITAWSTVPDYLALGVGSSTVQPGFENTCAGVSAKRTLQSIVTVENSVQQHLGVEMTVAGTTFGTQSNPVARKVVPILSRVTDLYGERGNKLKLE